MPVRRSRETHSSQVSFPIMWASSHLPAQMSFQRPLGWEALCGACSLFSAFSHSVEHGEPHQNSFIYLNIYLALLCARHGPRCWGQSCEQHKASLCPRGADPPQGRTGQYIR